MNATVLVVAKAPVAGRAKTRLVPPLTSQDAADLQRALLLDTIDACRAEVDRTAVLCAPEDAEAISQVVGPEVRIVSQEGVGLGAALQLGMARAVVSGPTALVSSDIPGVPPGSLQRAFDALAEADVVLGPAHDGGYWLIAMRAFHDAPFTDIPWSTADVLAVTLERCRAAGLRTVLVERWRDVDTAADLKALARERSAGADRTNEIVARFAAAYDLSDQRLERAN